VLVDEAGQLGTVSSSRRFKKEIKPMDKASEAILGLKPVTFQYKSDKTHTPQFGLIAEEVEKVNRDLVVRDKEGKPFTVRYEQINAMLLNEFLKEHKRVEEQQGKIENQQATIVELKSTVAQQQKGMELLTAQLKEQAAQIQKVSAQVQVNSSGGQVVANKR
jgi:trimeric autotransporter adhesin